MSIARTRFANLPTPIEPLLRLSHQLNGPEIYVKRDDETGLAFGGNKTRKLEFVISDALRKNAGTLITAGAAQSNHCRQTAAAAAMHGMNCILVLIGDSSQASSGNLLVDRLLGAEIVWTTSEKREAAMQKAFDAAQKAGQRPYLIPVGASDAIGATAYAFAFFEMMEQMPDVDWIIVPSASGGTHAGLVLGAKRTPEWGGKVLGISISQAEAKQQQLVAGLAAQASDVLGEHMDFLPQEILANADYLGGGYGVMGDPEKEAITLFARSEGLLLGPVYTARAAAGMIDLIRKGKFSKKEKVLFWHTGGAPALFADVYSKGLRESGLI